jgi:hypothetical protein
MVVFKSCSEANFQELVVRLMFRSCDVVFKNCSEANFQELTAR